MGFVGENAHGVCDVADAAEDEEQDADALGAFPAVVEHDLRDARSEIERSAEVAEELTPEFEVRRRGVLIG